MHKPGQHMQGSDQTVPGESDGAMHMQWMAQSFQQLRLQAGRHVPARQGQRHVLLVGQDYDWHAQQLPTGGDLQEIYNTICF